jgi:phosphatidylglycerol:prolipoprotein diacylglycerol transferase
MINFPNIDPVAIHIGPFDLPGYGPFSLDIRWYGLSYILGIGIGWWILSRRSQQNTGQWGQWTPEQVSDLVFYTALGAVLGGRLGYVLFYNLPVFLGDPLSIVRVWQGGMSFHGGLIGAILAMWLYARGEGRQFLAVTDFIAPVVPCGLFFGRIANFINGELWGAETSVPWGVVFPNPLAGPVPRHPSQLYEATLEGVVLFLILWWYTRHPRPLGAVSGLFLLCYGCFRFLIEFVRSPDVQLGYLLADWVTMGQVLSAPMVLVGLWLLLHQRSQTVAR